MTRIDPMLTGHLLTEYRRMNWFSRRRYSRQIDHRLRYVCPPDFSFFRVLETLFWLLVAGAFVACAIGFPVLFVRWCLCL